MIHDPDRERQGTVVQETCEHSWVTVDVTPLGANRHRLFDYCEVCGKRLEEYDGDELLEPEPV